jgi:hypothetical protein
MFIQSTQTVRKIVLLQSGFYLGSIKNSFNKFQSEKYLKYMYKFSSYFIKDTFYLN